jgi:hypothetical protein
MMSRVFSKEEDIMRAQQLELIYSQSNMLYEILPNAPQSNFNKTKQNYGPHVDGIVGSTQRKSTDQLTNQLHSYRFNRLWPTKLLVQATPVTQMSDVHSVQSTNPKGNQQTKGKRKSKNKKGKGDKKVVNNVGKGKNEKRKVKFLCKIFIDDHLTHQCPQLEEAQKLLAQQQPTCANQPFSTRENLTQASSSTNAPGGNQGAPMPNANNGATNIYMMKYKANL